MLYRGWYVGVGNVGSRVRKEEEEEEVEVVEEGVWEGGWGRMGRKR